VTISERVETARRERRVLTRVSRAGWRLEQSERERVWTRAEGVSIRKLAAAPGLSPSRVHQLMADAGLDVLDAALGELRGGRLGPPPKIRTRGGRRTRRPRQHRRRLSDEVSWLRQCAGWVAHLDAD
jgi:hypothetical protein